MNTMIRFDSQYFTPLSLQCKELMKSSLADRELHPLLLQEAYASIYKLAGAREQDHFIFTSSGTEAINHIIFSTYLEITRKTGKNHYLCAAIDEAAPIMAMERLQEMGCVFQRISADENGLITPKAVSEAISPRTALISLAWVNALTGVIQPVQEIAAICRDRGILFHVDASHILGKGNDTFDDCGADFLSFNGEEIHAPSGTGGFFFREGMEMSPFIMGGNEQGYLRGGNFNPSLILGLSQAAKEAKNHEGHLTMETTRLKTLFEKKVLEKIADTELLFPHSTKVPHITAFAFGKVHCEALAYLLDQKGLVAVFGGGKLQHFPHILKACKVKKNLIHSGLSFGFTHATTEDEIERCCDLLAECVHKLRKHSTLFMD